MVLLTKRFHFSASHRLFKPELTDEENAQIFGKCSNPNGHGHNYILEVTVEGEINPGTGYVIDLGELKNLIENEIINKVDHKNLNSDVGFLKGFIPTSENIITQFWNVVESKMIDNKIKLHSMKLFETENNIVEYYGGRL